MEKWLHCVISKLLLMNKINKTGGTTTQHTNKHTHPQSEQLKTRLLTSHINSQNSLYILDALHGRHNLSNMRKDIDIIPTRKGTAPIARHTVFFGHRPQHLSGDRYWVGTIFSDILDSVTLAHILISRLMVPVWKYLEQQGSNRHEEHRCTKREVLDILNQLNNKVY
jgi:hypothetical protein